jgi:hypothetical protein
MSSCTPMWMWVYSRGHPLPPSRLVQFNFSADGWSICRCLAVFPRHKGRTKLIPILPFWQFWVALITNRCVVTELTFIPELAVWLQLFSLSVLFFSVRVHWKSHLSNYCRSGLFCTSQLFLWVNHRIRKYLNFKHLKQKDNIFYQEGPAKTLAPPRC